MRLLRCLGHAGLVVLFGCRSEQSFADGMRAFCEAPRGLSGVPPEDRAGALAATIQRDVTNPEVLRMVEGLSGRPAEENDRVIRRAQQKAGLASCYFLDAPQAKQ